MCRFLHVYKFLNIIDFCMMWKVYVYESRAQLEIILKTLSLNVFKYATLHDKVHNTT